MAAHRVIVSGESRRIASGLCAQGALVFDGQGLEGLHGVQPGHMDAWLLDAETLHQQGTELVPFARRHDPDLAIVMTHDDRTSHAAAHRLGLDVGVDDVVADRSPREVTSRVMRAVAQRRARSQRQPADSAATVLLVDWHQTQTSDVEAMLLQDGYSVERTSDAHQALDRLRRTDPAVVVCPALAGPLRVPLVDAILRYDPRVRVIVTSPDRALSNEVSPRPVGAFDILRQPITAQSALLSIQKALPDAPARRPTTSPRQPVIAGIPRALRILVVDDEPLVRRVFQRMLTEHTVVTAETVRQALQHLDSGEQFDMILCDLMMPDVDGPAFHETLRARHPGLVERVVFCSGGAVTQRTQRFLTNYAPQLLKKPFSVNAVRTLLSKVQLSSDHTPTLTRTSEVRH